MEPTASRPKSKPGLIIRWLLAAAAILLAAIALSYWSATRPIPFERTAWDAAQDSPNDTTRHRMADGLVASKTLVGKSLAEVSQLLGPPDVPTFHAEYWNATYVLGPCRHLVGIDMEILALKLDASGVVSEVAVVED